MAKPNYYLYLDKRKDNGAVIYVGIGTKKRTQDYIRNEYHTNIKNKYGINREILLKSDDYSWIQIQEILAIKYYNTFWFDNKSGCNFTKGGDGTIGYKKTDEQIKEHKEMINKYWSNPKNRENVSNKLKGIKPNEETRINISKALGIKPFFVKKDDKIIGRYESLTICANEMNLNIGNISRCLKGQRKTHKGYTFEWENK